jgi:hypothetical protein
MEGEDISTITVSWLGQEHINISRCQARLIEYLCTRPEVSMVRNDAIIARRTTQCCYFHFPVQVAKNVVHAYTPGNAGQVTLDVTGESFQLAPDEQSIYHGEQQTAPECEKLYAAPTEQVAPDWQRFWCQNWPLGWSL